jgi:hypothetical protein
MDRRVGAFRDKEVRDFYSLFFAVNPLLFVSTTCSDCATQTYYGKVFARANVLHSNAECQSKYLCALVNPHNCN